MGEAKRRFDAGYRPIRNGEQIQVDLTNATPKVCECGCPYFIPAVQVYTVSAIVSPIGKELTAQQPVLVCMQCHKPLVIGEERKDDA
jgi:hypothetical protein